MPKTAPPPPPPPQCCGSAQCGLGTKPSTAKLRVALGILTRRPSMSLVHLIWHPSRDLQAPGPPQHAQRSGCNSRQTVGTDQLARRAVEIQKLHTPRVQTLVGSAACCTPHTQHARLLTCLSAQRPGPTCRSHRHTARATARNNPHPLQPRGTWSRQGIPRRRLQQREWRRGESASAPGCAAAGRQRDEAGGEPTRRTFEVHVVVVGHLQERLPHGRLHRVHAAVLFVGERHGDAAGRAGRVKKKVSASAIVAAPAFTKYCDGGEVRVSRGTAMASQLTFLRR